MRKYRWVEVHGTKDELESIKCDWCHLKFETEEAFNGENDAYDDNPFKFEVQKGTRFPEGNCGERWVCDICFACRRLLINKMIKWGIRIYKEDY